MTIGWQLKHHMASLGKYAYYLIINLMNGKALRKHSLHKKTAASVLLKLFTSGNE